MAGVIDWGGRRNGSMRGMNTTPTPHQHQFADVAARNRYVSAIDLGEIQASDQLHAVARLAARWIALQTDADTAWDDESLRALARGWLPRNTMELALLPDAKRIWAAALQELLELLAQSPQGRQALADFGFKPFLEHVADVAARNRYVSAIDLGEIQASDPLYAPAGCFSVTLESLVLHPNGWVLSGRGDAQTFWLQVQQVGWMRFERVPRPDCSTDAISQATSWIATEMHPGPCPDPHQSVSWSGVLWTRRAALQAHQAICAYQQGLGQID